MAEYPSLGLKESEIQVRGIPAEEELIATQRPIVFADVSQAGDVLGPVLEVFHQFDIRSILIVPVIVDGWVVGSFSLDATGRHIEFTAEQVERCKIFATQVAAAVKSVFHADRLQVIRETTLAITSQQMDRQTLLSTIIQNAVMLLNAKSGGLYEYCPQRGELVVVADYGRLASVIGQKLNIGEGVAGKLVQGKAPFMIIDDYNNWVGRAEIYSEKRPFGSVLEVPLIWSQEHLGVLYVDDVVGRKFNREDATLLQLFADHAAIALINSQSMEAEHQKVLSLKSLSTITSEMVRNFSSLSREDGLSVVAADVTRLLNAEVCSIFQVVDEQLKLVASYGHPSGGFEYGKLFDIRSAPRGGLTGHIASEGMPFRIYGRALLSHWAVKGEPVIHTSSKDCFSLMMVPFVQRTGESSQIVGWMRVDNKMARDGQPNLDTGFSDEDEFILTLFADATSVALQTARLVDKLNGIQKNVRLVARVSVTEPLDKTLTPIAEATRMAIGCDGVALFMYDQHRNLLRFPPATVGIELHGSNQKRLSKNSLPYRILEGTASDLYIDEVQPDMLVENDFVDRGEFISSAAMPLEANNRKVGVMFIYYRSSHEFTEKEQHTFRLFADQAAMVLSNGQLYEELKQLQGRLTTRAVQAWFNITDNYWRVEIDKHATTIHYEVEALQSSLPLDSLDEKVRQRLEKINRLAIQISKQPLTLPLSSEEVAESILINDMVQERLKQLWERKPYSEVECILDLKSSDRTTIRASREWLRRVLDILIDNAVAATAQADHRRLFIHTELNDDGMLLLSFEDTGVGMPENVRERLFEGQIPKLQREKGLGMGLLMAQAIVRTYGGEIKLAKTSTQGTCMVVELPAEI